MPSFSNESLEIESQGETLLLHPQRALFWPAQKILFVADVHVGKEHRFGRSGIAIPGGISDDVLAKLFALCEKAAAQRLIVLGDFMHSIPVEGESWLATLSHLLDKHPHLSMDIVAGNHDRLAGQVRIDPRVKWHAEELHLSPFVLKHEPDEHSEGFVLAGHLHPAWRLSQSRRSSIKAPAFWFRKHCAVLPAFGDFTGGVTVSADPSTDRIYLVGPECVVNVPLRPKKHSRKNAATF
jgi:DNA ligase-associated metallophosphoesterase